MGQRLAKPVFALVVVATASCFAQEAPEAPPLPPTLQAPEGLPAILLAETERPPKVRVSWPTRSGKPAEFEGERRYGSSGDRQPLGANVSCYVAMGGTRLERGAGHPKGAVVQVGLGRIDSIRPFFADIAEDPVVSIRLTGVFMNQPVTPRPGSVVMRLRYQPDDLAACGLGGSASSLFLTASRTDTLRGRITPDTGRLGVLDGAEPGHGSVKLTKEADGSVTLDAQVPYALLRHIKDPWLRTQPGTFLEPAYFHIEFEVIPDWVVEAEKAAAAVPNADPPPIDPPG